MSFKISRASYAAHYGPTVGDRVRLADTELLIEIEKDYTLSGNFMRPLRYMENCRRS